MRTFGLRSTEILELKKLFQKFFGDLEDTKIYLFGSRATGKHKKYSDIDIAIKSKSKEITKRIPFLTEAAENSNLPYKIDVTLWNEIFKPYLPQIKKEKILIWIPDEKSIHPWRTCPYGEHWVVRHPRYSLGKRVQDVDGLCRKNPRGKDIFRGDEIDLISKTSPFKDTLLLPCPYTGKDKVSNSDKFDVLIAGWCKYWNDIFKPDIPIDPNFVKALIESESTFNPNSFAKNKKITGASRGLVQLTEQSLRILKDKKGEIKDHYIELSGKELFEPSKNICAAIRWMFRKREILQKRLGRSPSWVEVVVEYKGLGKQLQTDGKEAKRIMDKFHKMMERYKC
jgi:predicted nucleotidyltransferase